MNDFERLLGEIEALSESLTAAPLDFARGVSRLRYGEANLKATQLMDDLGNFVARLSNQVSD